MLFTSLSFNITIFNVFLYFTLFSIQDELYSVYKDRCLIRKHIIDCEATEKELKIKLFQKVCMLKNSITALKTYSLSQVASTTSGHRVILRFFKSSIFNYRIFNRMPLSNINQILYILFSFFIHFSYSCLFILI